MARARLPLPPPPVRAALFPRAPRSPVERFTGRRRAGAPFADRPAAAASPERRRRLVRLSSPLQQQQLPNFASADRTYLLFVRFARGVLRFESQFGRRHRSLCL